MGRTTVLIVLLTVCFQFVACEYVAPYYAEPAPMYWYYPAPRSQIILGGETLGESMERRSRDYWANEYYRSEVEENERQRQRDNLPPRLPARHPYGNGYAPSLEPNDWWND